MTEAIYPKPVGEVIATLADIFRNQARTDVVELLETAHAHFSELGYDNWNGGTITWALRLEVPVPLYAKLEPRLSAVEAEISTKLNYLERLLPNDRVCQITITPITAATTALVHHLEPTDVDVQRLWPHGRFRLFLSHLAEHKVAVSKLRDELRYYGVSAFVAHEDIKPSSEWQREIELALRSMHGLLALLTPRFHKSLWTDQEIGWAYGRGVLVVPVRLGFDPYGFAGKVQAISGALEESKLLAKAIFDTLLTNPQTHSEVRRAYVEAFCHSSSFNHSILLRDYIKTITDFTEEEKVVIKKACADNDQLANAFHVKNIVYETFGSPPESASPTQGESHDLPF